MVALPPHRPRTARPSPRPTRFILTCKASTPEAHDVALIEAVPGLRVVARAHNMLLVRGPADLATLQAALPGLTQRWTFAREVFYRTQAS